MKTITCRNWSIKARVIVITTVPLVLLFVSMLLYSYFSRSAEVEEELEAGGHLIASLVAESSEYGVESEPVQPRTYATFAAAGGQEHLQGGGVG